MKYFWIAAFGLLGVFTRFGVWSLSNKLMPSPFPYGTFLINLLGAFLVGVIYVLGVERMAISPDLRMGLVVGFLGGFTTFSAYCLEAAELFENGNLLVSVLYLSLSPLCGFALALLGMFLTRRWFAGI